MQEFGGEHAGGTPSVHSPQPSSHSSVLPLPLASWDQALHLGLTASRAHQASLVWQVSDEPHLVRLQKGRTGRCFLAASF